jgi:Cu+-exporting ATPase
MQPSDNRPAAAPCCSSKGDHRNDHGHGHGAHVHAHAGAHTVLDPVCGMTVDPAKTPHHASHDGHDFHFCSAGCRTKFIADPASFL